MVRVLITAALTLTLAACSLLGDLGFMVQPPRFEEAQDRTAEIRLVGPSVSRPLGGASVRLWATVTNPNRFGFTLATLRGALFLQDDRAADIDLPLGLPLIAGATETFPIDFSISFADLPGLADAIRRAIGREPLDYRFDGTVGIDAGQYGRPEFGPKTWLRGTVRGDARPMKHITGFVAVGLCLAARLAERADPTAIAEALAPKSGVALAAPRRAGVIASIADD